MKKRRAAVSGMLDLYEDPATQQASNPEIQQYRNTSMQEHTAVAGATELKKVTFQFESHFAKDLKVAAAKEEISMRDYVIRAIRYWEQHHPEGGQGRSAHHPSADGKI